ncbi:MAG TPA: hypothetical protein VFQ53_28320 [Kofleriaceae bacterium]|nr:hypothetical protein [Kofleriaceae bacterium]
MRWHLSGPRSFAAAILFACCCGCNKRAATEPVTDIVELEQRDKQATKAWLDILAGAQEELELCADPFRTLVRNSHNPRAGKFDVVGYFTVRYGISEFARAKVTTRLDEAPALKDCIQRVLSKRTGHAAGEYAGFLRVHLCIQRERPSLTRKRGE